MKNNTALFTVFYPSVEPYVSDFLHSLCNQTDKNFTLYLLNDGLPNVEEFLEGKGLPFKVMEKTGNPAALRKAGIQWAVAEGAEKIIFADADDFFADNRIEISIKMMADYDVVCNDILLTGEHISRPVSMFGPAFKDQMEITANDIVNGNCLGLSNTSIKADRISELLAEIPDDIIAFDWIFYALCLHAGGTAIYTNNTHTYYRQHEGNIASPMLFSEEQILRAIRVKRDHYKCLAKYYKEYTKLSKRYDELYTRIQSDSLLKNDYCKSIQLNTGDVSLWWEPIKTLQELRL